MSNIMENIPRPSFIDVSFSAPASVLPTRPPSSLAQAPAAAVSFSHPVSPIAKKVLSPIVRKKSSPKKMNSPDRLIRRRNSQVTFNNFNPRALKQDPQCPAHSYVGIEQELKVLPNKVINNAVKFSETPREAFEPLRPNCPVHVYQEAKTTLRSLGGTFTRAVDPAAPAKCPVHFYETPRSTLKKSGATAFSMDSRDAAFDSARRALAPVHAYETPRSTLKTSGATAFSTEHRGRNAFQNGPAGLARAGAFVRDAALIPQDDRRRHLWQLRAILPVECLAHRLDHRDHDAAQGAAHAQAAAGAGAAEHRQAGGGGEGDRRGGR